MICHVGSNVVGTLVLRLKLGAKSSCTEPSNLGAKEVGAEPGDLTQRAALAPPSALLPPLLYLKRTEAPTVTAAHITIHCHRPHLPVPSAASEAGNGRLASHTRARSLASLGRAAWRACRAVPSLSLTFILPSPSAVLFKRTFPLLRDPDLRLLFLLLCCYSTSPSPALRAHHRREPVPPTPAIKFLGSNCCVFTGVRFTVLDTPPSSNDYTAPRLLPVRLRRTDCTASTDLPASNLYDYIEQGQPRDIMSSDGIPPAGNGATDASGKAVDEDAIYPWRWSCWQLQQGMAHLNYTPR
nr:unnamed protein product [Digitaria exilis]